MLYDFTASVVQSGCKRFWILNSNELKGCCAQGDTIEEAIKELEANEKEWIKTAMVLNIPVPKPVGVLITSTDLAFKEDYNVSTWIDIRTVDERVEVFCNGEFIFSADTIEEARRELRGE